MPPSRAAVPPKDDPDRNLYRRGDTWWCRYVLGGREQRRSLGTPDVRKARKERDSILREVADRREGKAPPETHTWQQAVRGYLALAAGHVASGELAAETEKRYGVSIVQITLALAGEPEEDGSTTPVPLSSITRATVLEFVEARREEERAPSTILNDLTAWSRVLAYAEGKGWLEVNVARSLDRKMFVGTNSAELCPPTDEQVAELIQEVGEWSADMALLIRWLRETGMRLAEALNARAEDVHPDRQRITLSERVKGGKVRTIHLGRAAALLDQMPRKGRLFAGLHRDSAVVSTRYGQWRRQRQARENRAAAESGREAEELLRFRLHDERHAYAIASIIDDDTCIYRLREHLGHGSVTTTESYVRYLAGAGAMRRYARRPDLFGSLSATAPPRQVAAAA